MLAAPLQPPISLATRAPGAVVLAQHPERAVLAEELHSRPHAELSAPLAVSHVARLIGEDAVDDTREAVARLCRRYSAPPPHQERHYAVEIGSLHLRWEQHTEFATFTFLRRGADAAAPFRFRAIDLVPPDWLAGLGGPVLAATHLVLEPNGPARGPAELEACFERQALTASRVMDGAAEVWTDFRIHGDGFGRWLVRDRGLTPGRAGRLVQRLLEIDTYRMMALLGLPAARADGPRLTALEHRLAGLVARLSRAWDLAAETALLDELFALAREAERMVAETAFRFGATRAYAQLVRDRLREIGEGRLDGDLQPLGEFLERRFEPAVRTCLSRAERQEALSGRIAHTAALARTHVDVELQRQNQALLTSMERRAQLQLRLQETVEGLSVAAISYYVVGLLGYVIKGAAGAGLPADAQGLALAVATPLAVAAVWLGVQRLRRRIHREP